jgi:hypothetical protein
MRSALRRVRRAGQHVEVRGRPFYEATLGVVVNTWECSTCLSTPRFRKIKEKRG